EAQLDERGVHPRASRRRAGAPHPAIRAAARPGDDPARGPRLEDADAQAVARPRLPGLPVEGAAASRHRGRDGGPGSRRQRRAARRAVGAGADRGRPREGRCRIGCRQGQVLQPASRHPHRQEGVAADPLHLCAASQGCRTAAAAARGCRIVILLTIIIDLDPNIARIGPLLITWHGVFSVLGILAAARLGFWLLEKDVPNLRGTGDGLAWMVVVGLIGARLLYVWENFRIFSGNLLRMFALT